METFVYISFFILYAFCGYLLYLNNKTLRKIQEQDIAHKKSLVEAGNAITETLRVAFDNLKRNTTDHNKINSKIVEHSGRIHRLEQYVGKSTRDIGRREENTNVPFETNKKRINNNEDEN